MSLLQNYWKDTACSVKKVGLALRALVATVGGSAFVQNDVKFAFYALLAGGVLEFVLQNLPPDKTDGTNNNTPTGGSSTPAAGVAVIALLMMIFATSCTTIKPQVNRTKSDSTYTTYKQVDIKLTGAKVIAGLNIDSLYHAALMNKDQYKDDSIARLNVQLQYAKDSLTAAKANKPIPPKPVYIPSPPKKEYVTDPQTKAQLSYWIDAYGKFQIQCESKDQTITTLQAQVNKLTTDKTTTIDVAYKTPAWNKFVMILEAALLLVAILIIVFKSIL
jgi:hypothetical protein